MSLSDSERMTADPRPNKTRADLRKALLRLSEERGYTKVTVVDIAFTARVNRSTFYRHYDDREDLAVDVLAHFLDSIIRANPEFNAAIDVNAVDRRQAGAKIFTHIATHKAMYRYVFGYPRERRYMTRIRNLLTDSIAHRVDAVRPSSSHSTMPVEIVIAFTVEALIGVIAWWIDGRDEYGPEEMAGWFLTFIDRGYFHALGLDNETATNSAIGSDEHDD